MDIDKLIKEAMLEKNSAKKEAYRAIKAELLLIQTGSGGQKARPVTEVDDPEITENKIQEAVVTAYPNGFTQKEMGKVIKEIKNIYPTADGKLISEVVKKHIV